MKRKGRNWESFGLQKPAMHCNILATSVSKHLFLEVSLFYPILAAIKKGRKRVARSHLWLSWRQIGKRRLTAMREGPARGRGWGRRKSNTPPAAKEPPQNWRCSHLFVEEIAKNNVFFRQKRLAIYSSTVRRLVNEYMIFSKNCYFRLFWGIPSQSFKSHVSPQDYGLGL
jgi:hypothetical protein